MSLNQSACKIFSSCLFSFRSSETWLSTCADCADWLIYSVSATVVSLSLRTCRSPTRRDLFAGSISAFCSNPKLSGRSQRLCCVDRITGHTSTKRGTLSNCHVGVLEVNSKFVVVAAQGRPGQQLIIATAKILVQALQHLRQRHQVRKIST